MSTIDRTSGEHFYSRVCSCSRSSACSNSSARSATRSGLHLNSYASPLQTNAFFWRLRELPFVPGSVWAAFRDASCFVSRGHAKVAYMISHLSGRAEAWPTVECARDSPVCYSVDTFKDTLSKNFDQSTPGREAARALMGLRQGKGRVTD